jgi:predicted nucleic acid-binding protein
MYALDTNALIYATQDADVAERFERILAEQTPLFVSTISAIELFSSVHTSRAEQAALERLLAGCRIVPVDMHIARLAAELRRNCRIKTPDAAIAATALSTYSSLVTRNVKDFAKVPGLSILAI